MCKHKYVCVYICVYIYICTVHQINSNPPCYKTPTKWTLNRWVKSAYSVLHVAVCSSPFPSTSMSWLSQTETFFCHPYRTPKIYDSHTHGIRVWYIYLHLVDFYGKCRWICHTWILWDILRIKQAMSSTILEGILFSPFSIHYCQPHVVKHHALRPIALTPLPPNAGHWRGFLNSVTSVAQFLLWSWNMTIHSCQTCKRNAKGFRKGNM